MPEDTFNSYLFLVDKYRRRGRSRDQALWAALVDCRPLLAEEVRGGKGKDPMGMGQKELDSWLGWLVGHWDSLGSVGVFE